MTTTTDTTILWLDDPAAGDVGITGGKAANLSRLAARHAVPPGFCLTASVFECLSAESDGSEPDTMPASLRSRIAEAYAILGEMMGTPEPGVAVRSSGLDEDGAATSFAGQFDTYLNVSGIERLCAAVLACWGSGGNERVTAYRADHHLQSGAGVAVLVQELIPADSAMVAFSANPVTSSRDEVVINASFGLGESIVGGTVTPDTYVVHKAELDVADVRVASKRRMTVRVPDGTREVDVPRFMQLQQVLSEEQMREVARLAVDLEAAMGWPVDVECAYSKGTLYLLQCRPITTLR